MKEKIIYKGPSTLGILGIVFVALKLLEYISWSWWWVTAPFWAPIALAIGLVILVILVILITVITVAVSALCEKW